MTSIFIVPNFLLRPYLCCFAQLDQLLPKQTQRDENRSTFLFPDLGTHHLGLFRTSGSTGFSP